MKLEAQIDIPEICPGNYNRNKICNKKVIETIKEEKEFGNEKDGCKKNLTQKEEDKVDGGSVQIEEKKPQEITKEDEGESEGGAGGGVIGGGVEGEVTESHGSIGGITEGYVLMTESGEDVAKRKVKGKMKTRTEMKTKRRVKEVLVVVWLVVIWEAKVQIFPIIPVLQATLALILMTLITATSIMMMSLSMMIMTVLTTLMRISPLMIMVTILTLMSMIMTTTVTTMPIMATTMEVISNLDGLLEIMNGWATALLVTMSTTMTKMMMTMGHLNLAGFLVVVMARDMAIIINGSPTGLAMTAMMMTIMVMLADLNPVEFLAVVVARGMAIIINGTSTGPLVLMMMMIKLFLISINPTLDWTSKFIV
uniref:Uncharacterized protein n=1 Tax=Echinococcus granulosus TaxID=6210 RepID=A0A068WMJ3_ECHGR|nr:hypothetical protein EgrG_000172000 [Echinococcus granulosus]